MIDMYEDEKLDPLCCCEYFDRNNERNHLIGCCCNCVDFDTACDRLITCRSVSSRIRTNMLLTFQDRIRIPWRGGAKQISLEAIIPMVVIPLSLFIAALNLYCCIVICLVIPLCLGYAYYFLCSKSHIRTKFFFLWSFWSVAYLWILFEATVPLMELLPEENVLLVLMITAALYCFYKVKLRAPLNHVVQSTNDEDNLPDITEEQVKLLINDDDTDESEENPNICSKCHKYVPPRTFHCSICQACIVKRDHHNIWLDACIGESNHRFFFFGCIISILALTLGTNLSLTSICHPFLIGKIFGIPIFLPDDCSEVFDQYDVALCFVGSIYGIMLAICLTMVLAQQFYFISKGVTGTEWSRGEINSRKHCFTNWKIFCCWLR